MARPLVNIAYFKRNCVKSLDWIKRQMLTSFRTIDIYASQVVYCKDTSQDDLARVISFSVQKRNLFWLGALLRDKGDSLVFNTISSYTLSAPGPQGLVRPSAYAQNLFTRCLRLTCSQVQHLPQAVR